MSVEVTKVEATINAEEGVENAATEAEAPVTTGEEVKKQKKPKPNNKKLRQGELFYRKYNDF